MVAEPLTMGGAVDFNVVECDDEAAAVEWFFASGLTDALPVVPPTRDRVARMIAGGHLPEDAILGVIPQRRLSISVRQAAICAVMAGALREYFPVVIASWQAILQPDFNANAVLATRSGPAITCVVSGPYARTIGMNGETSLLGPGNRPNATIGRAVRLGAMMVFQARPGALDASSFGQGGKYSAHFAEAPPPEPWMPLNVQAGHSPNVTTVTALGTDMPRIVKQNVHQDPEKMMRVLATPMRDPTVIGAGTNGTGFLVIVGPEHTRILVEGGVTQNELRDFLARESWISLDDYDRSGVGRETREGFMRAEPDAAGRSPTTTADEILIVTAGGGGAGFSVVVPTLPLPPNRLPAPVVVVEPS